MSELFCLLPKGDKDVLREYYRDFRCASDGVESFPFSEIDDFLVNLDGGKNSKGKHVGSCDWRYFLIEEMQAGRMPVVSIEFLHEIVYGAIRIAQYGVRKKFKPSRYTYSWRRHFERSRRYQDWLTVRMNLTGWDRQGDRLEILWGPDYRNRSDYLVSKGKGRACYFGVISESHGLPVQDRRAEVEALEVDPIRCTTWQQE